MLEREIKEREFARRARRAHDFAQTARNFAEQDESGDECADQVNAKLRHIRPDHCVNPAEIRKDDRGDAHHQTETMMIVSVGSSDGTQARSGFLSPGTASNHRRQH